ncbi:DUF4129 domain-containing protein [Salinibacillus xinjiangensis]|uniref:DUF4129 domain-containing protein n=1 Tax=Salinibacillus xinjiangensis TaxID=1229268 RepID=A0A6G1X959_9BACI|nr:DUF4129 domain-containing protein [Salinibacillus xinjiangensis]MRG87477.1 DUF4129 domain-containing protein [Salinibacillus xinjiangensis]
MLNEKQVRDELEQILSENEYRVYYDESQNIVQLILNKIGEWLSELFSNLLSAMNPTGGLANFVLFLMGLGVVGLILFALFLWGRNAKVRRALQTHQPLQKSEMDWSYHRHLNEAQQLEDSQEFQLATRHLFLALLLYLHDLERLEARLWKTNIDYYEELQKSNQYEAEQFYRLALRFDEATYGEKAVRRQDYLTYKEQAMDLLARGE